MLIEKNIDIPDIKHIGRKRRKDSILNLLEKMEVGDSFLYLGNKSTIRSRVNKHKCDKEFTSRTVEGGTRVWRIK